MGPDRHPPARGALPCCSAEIAWHSGLPHTARENFVAPLAVVVVGPPSLGDAGLGGSGVGNQSAFVGRCDAARAGAAGVGMDWSVAAGTAVWEKAVGIAPGWPGMWAVPGPAGVGAGTGPSAAAGGSWDCCAGLVTPLGPDVAAAGEASGEWPAEAKPERMEVQGHPDWAEGPAVAAEDLPHPLHLFHPLADQPWRSAAASGGGAGAGASVGVQLWLVAGPLILGNLAPAGQGDHQVAENQERALRVGPVPLKGAASQAVPCSLAPVGAVAAGIAHDSLPFVVAVVVAVAVAAAVGDVVS